MHQRSALDPQGHSQLLLGMIEEVLSEAGVLRDDLDAIVYDAGPGSFTGIRIGAGVAQGIALALEKPLFAISSLMTLAEAKLALSWRLWRRQVRRQEDAAAASASECHRGGGGGARGAN